MSPMAPAFLEQTEDILEFVLDSQAQGEPSALCVVTHFSGGSARAVGTLVAVRRDGEMAGYVSHGCIDADLSLQAKQAIEAGQPRKVLYGVGSPFMDLQLPCGGSVEILIDPSPSPRICATAAATLKGRRPVSLLFSEVHGFVGAWEQMINTGWIGRTFCAWHPPRLRLLTAGAGPPVLSVVTMAQAMRVPVSILSPDEKMESHLSSGAVENFQHLTSQNGQIDVAIDPWTAVLLLFHDHEWEQALLMQALANASFYIGALGSARTHARRLESLSSLGVMQSDLARITGPVGVIRAARDAHTLAVSVLAEIVDCYRDSAREAHGPALDAIAV